MQNRYKKLAIKTLVLTLFLLSSIIGYGQSVTGPSPVNINQVATYTYNNGRLIKFASWQVTKGTIQSTLVLGTRQSVTVKWTSSGTGKVALYSGTRLKSSKNVTVNTPINPGVVSPATVSICSGATTTLTVQNNGYPVNRWQYSTGDYINWYNVSSTATTYTTPKLTQTRKYRAVTVGAQGTFYSAPVLITVNSKPSTPPSPTITQYCGSTKLTRVTPPSGYTYYWQTSSSGTSTSNSNSTYTVTSSKTVYLRSRKSSTGCWSASPSASVTVIFNPSTPSTPTKINNCGSTKLTRGTPPSGVTWYWQGTNSSGTSTSNTSSTYTATSDGTYYIRARLNSSPYCWSTSRAVSVNVNELPSTPSSPTVTLNCGSTTINRGTPSSGLTWYWQGTNSSGTSTSNSNVNYTITSAGTYYLRARNNSSGCWSSLSRATSVSINAIPPKPATPTTTYQCGSTKLTRGLPPSGVTWYWQGTNSSGTSTSNSSVNYTVTSAGTYYLRARNNSSGCWMTSSKAISVSIKTNPPTPSTPTQINNCGSTKLTRGTPSSGVTWYWQGTSSSGTSTSNTSSTYTATSDGTYYIRARLNSSPYCWSTSRAVSVNVNELPSTPGTTTVILDCASTTITRGTLPSGVTWYWQGSNSAGTSISNSNVNYTTSSAGTYYLRARNNSSGCWSTSSRATSVSINAKPSKPLTPTQGTQYCGSTTIGRDVPPSGVTWYWQGTNSSGTSTSNSNFSYTATSSGTYYLRTRNNSTGCWSGSSSSVSITIIGNPATPSNPGIDQYCYETIATMGSAPSGITWYWQTTSTGTSTSNSLSTYSTTTTKTVYLRARRNSSPYCWSSARTVSLTIKDSPDRPSNVIINDECGYTELERLNPPANETWYWQGANGAGMDMVNSGVTYNVYSPGTYYLRAFNNDSYCWSEISAKSIITSITPVPQAPDPINISDVGCRNTEIQRGTPTNADETWYWQTSDTGTNTLDGDLTKTVTSDGTYYLRTHNSTTGCWSDATSRFIDVNEGPSDLTNPTIGDERIGTGILTLKAGDLPGEGNSFAWYTSPTGGTPIVEVGVLGKKYEPKLSTTTTFYIAEVDASGCESANRVAVTGTVHGVPLITVNGNTVQATNRILAYGQGATMAASSGFDTYLWQVYGDDLSGTLLQSSNQASFELAGKGSCMLTVTKGAATYTTQQYMFDYDASTTKANYVHSRRILQAGITTEEQLFNLSDNNIQQTITYSDGLDRVLQTRVLHGAGVEQDIVQNYSYDEYGRVSTQYLPYTANELPKGYYNLAIATTGFDDFYASKDFGNDNNYAFAITKYDNTPLHRVIEQGAPGADWQPENGHTIRSNIALETAGGNIRKWNANGQSSETYTANKLVEKTITDENDHIVRSYTDSRGLTILKQVQEGSSSYLNTYYVYDGLGRSVYTIPPKAVEEMQTANNWDVSLPNVAELIYSYNYDNKGRLVIKKVPGAQPEYMVYDRYDRLVLMQDGNLRANSQWNFIKYDFKGRAAYTGVYTNTVETTLADVQTLADGFDYDNTWYEKQEANATYQGYSNRVFPITNLEVLAVNYYDNYDFDRNGTADYSYNSTLLSGQEPTANSHTRGIPTGKKTKILDGANWLTTVVFYDTKGRMIEWQSNNHLDAAMNDAGAYVYNFAGQLLTSKTIVSQGGGQSLAFQNRYMYDNAGRITELYQTNGTDMEQKVADYTYNELGQLTEKKLHQLADQSYLQTVDYAYNIRGWLKSINDPDNITAEQLFGMELVYNETLGALGQTQAYNGNISAIKWKNNFTDQSKTQAYAYQYDNTDRLKDANYGKGVGLSSSLNAFNLNNVGYDANGNITALQRKTENRAGVPELIDNLTYTLTGNRLDAVADTEGSEGFENVIGTDYTYDANGNLTADANKDIQSIVYNVLNKPKTITFGDGAELRYTYDATGTKLAQELYLNGTLDKRTDYLKGAVYQNGTLQFAPTPEGRIIPVIPEPVPGSPSYEYQYHLTDHLGNVRTVVTSEPKTDTYTATMETENIGNGIEDLFTNLDLTRTTFANANVTAGGNEAAELDDTKPVGPGMILPVFPGDVVDLDVWGYYEGGSGYNTAAPAGMVTGIAAAFGGVSGVAGEAGAIYNGLSSAIAALGFGGTDDDTRPAAYLNYIVLDKNYTYVSDNAFGYTQIPANASFSQQQMSLPGIIIKKEGYIFVYVSYESQVHNRVFFDDLTVTHHQSPVVQSTNYYPFGLQHATSWTRSTTQKNNRLYNAGSELNEQTKNYETFYRQYDPAIGRFTAIDPVAAKYASTTPYNYAFNDPIALNDPLGDDPMGDCIVCNRTDYRTTMDQMNAGDADLASRGQRLNSYGGMTGAQYDQMRNNRNNWERQSNVSYEWRDIGDGKEGLFELVSMTIHDKFVGELNGRNEQNNPNSDLVAIARALSKAKGGEKWDDVIDPSVWARYLHKKRGMGGGFSWAGKIGGIKVDGYSGSNVEFSQVRFYSPVRQRIWYFKIIPENLKKENFPLNNPVSGKEFEYPYKIRVSGYFDQRPSQVMTFGFSSWKNFTVFSEIIMGIR